MYRAHWGGSVPHTLEAAPFLTAWAWRRLIRRDLPGAPRQPAALWALQPVAGDDPVWMPFTHEDIGAGARRARTMFRDAGIRPGDVVLSVAPEGPWIGNATPYLISASDALVPGEPPLGAEVLPLSLLTVSFKADLTVFPFARAPSVLVGTAADLLAVAEAARAAGARPLRPRLLLLSGPATDPALIRDLAETVVDLVHLPGAFAPFGGHPGEVGFWVPNGVRLHAELIPDEEWGRSVADPAHRPRSLPLAAALGLSGELVVTVDNQALPLIRFRTQERVRVAEVQPESGVRVERLPSTAVPADGARPAVVSRLRGSGVRGRR